MRRRWAWASMAFLGVATAAYAVNKGDTLYIRARDTGLMDSPKPTAKTVAVLQPGMEVTYVAPASKATGWHEVEAAAKHGFVYQSNLSKQKPSGEVVAASGKPIDPAAFASSGAATKALSEGAVNYGTSTHPDYARAVKDIQATEAIAKSIGSPQLFSHEQDAHLHAMVGKKGATP